MFVFVHLNVWQLILQKYSRVLKVCLYGWSVTEEMTGKKFPGRN